MSEAPSHRQFFGDAERDFALPPEMIIELERVTGSGIGALARRLATVDFRYQELLDIIRLGLIGGGEKPEIAAALVNAYAVPRPIGEVYDIASDIMAARMYPKATAPAKKGARK